MIRQSFVDFYSKHDISPVSQDISDLDVHFQRRGSLYLSLGVPPLLVKDKSFLEFGPGSGHNATYTANLSPKRYYLIDGNPKGVIDTKNILASYNVKELSVISALFLEYESSIKHDIVWAEGCIPHQSEPIRILKHLSSFVNKNGIFVVSTVNGVSYLSEIIRRLASTLHVDKSNSLHEQVQTVRPLIENHLKHLKYMSRPVDDWIIDNILQPLHETRLLSIPDVLEALWEDYHLYGASPKFITDWRWYKENVGDNYDFNQTGINCYYKNNLNLIDYRFNFDAHSTEFGTTLENTCAQSWDIMCQIQKGDSTKWQSIILLLQEISTLIKPMALETSKAIDEACIWLEDEAPVNKKLNYLPQWWGRGQQYLSLIRK